MILGRRLTPAAGTRGNAPSLMLCGKRGLASAAMGVVGFIGVGNMGSGMIRNLAGKGFPLAIFDASKDRAREVRAAVLKEFKLPSEAITVTDTVAEMAQRCPTICASLPSEKVGDKVFTDLLTGAQAKGSQLKTVIDHGTVGVAFTHACRDRFASAANHPIMYLDAPVSGGPEGAKKGTLSIMVGGTPDTFNHVSPVLDAMGALVVHMGPSGAGTAAKLVNQLLTGVHVHAAAEAYALAKSLGIADTKALLNLLEQSWGHSTMLQRCGGALAQAEGQGSLQELSTSGAPIRNFVKDFGMISAAAKGAGLALPLTTQAQRGFEQGVTVGLQDWDIAATVRLIEGFDAEGAVKTKK